MLYLHDFTYLKAKLKYIYNNNNNNNLYKTIAVLMTDFLSWLVIINYFAEYMSKMLQPRLFLTDIRRFLLGIKVSIGLI